MNSELNKLLDERRSAIDEGRYGDAGAAGSKFMDMLLEEMIEEGPPVEVLIGLEACACKENGDWAGAEAAYRKLLEMQLASNSPFGIEHWAYSELAGLKALLDEHETAYELAQAATAAARRSNLELTVSITLVGEVWALVPLGRFIEAEAAADEAVQILGDGKQYDAGRGQALVARAYCRFELENHEAAAIDLDNAWKCLAPYSVVKDAAGIQSTLATYWWIKATMQAAGGDWASASVAWSNAIAHRRSVAGQCGVNAQHALAKTLWRFANTAIQAGDNSQAEAALAECRSIRERIHLPPLT